MIKKISSSGAFFLSKKTKRFLLLQKASGKKEGTWGLVGGKTDPGESFWQGLQREIYEEIGFNPNIIKTIPLETFVSDDNHFNFQTYICIVENEFIPILSNEHKGWAWCDIESWPKPIHQGIKNTISSKITRAKIDTIFELLDSIVLFPSQ
jgi:8-oxo-dGTP pyrophosphatase MutT (NUDIX family)